MSAVPKQKPIRDRAYLDSFNGIACIVCGDTRTTVGAHIRWGLAGGMGMKPGDNRVLPLCFYHHDLQGRIGEPKFWREHAPVWLLMEGVSTAAQRMYQEWLDEKAIRHHPR